jgi:hypothetical protein
VNVLHRPTALRAGVLAAGLTLVLYALTSLLAPTLVDLSSAGSARTLSLVVGVLVRVLAGRLAARRAWAAGADLTLVLVSVGVGGAAGWLFFPGLISLVGVLTGGSPASDLLGLVVDLLVWVAALWVGAVTARWPEQDAATAPVRPAPRARRR